jgi:hypothetical protein
VKGDMTGRRGGSLFLEGGSILKGDWISVWIFSGVGSFDIGSFSEPLQGHRVAGGFGHGGQDSFRYPGAREPDRLLLAGWEVSRFGQGWSVHQAGQGSRERTTRSMGELASGRGKVFYVFVLCIIRNMQCYVVVCK